MESRLAIACGIDLKHSNRYKIIQRSYKNDQQHFIHQSKSSKLDLMGNLYIPPPDDCESE